MKFKKYISAVMACVMLLACVPVRAEQAETEIYSDVDWIQELLLQAQETAEPEPTPEPPGTVYYQEPESTHQPDIAGPEETTEIVPYEMEAEPAENEASLPQAGTPSTFDAGQDEKWKTLFSDQFGDDYLMPFKKNGSGQSVSGKANRLVIQETDLTLPGKNGLDINIIRKHDNQDYNESYTGVTNANDAVQFRNCYSFNTSDGESFYIAFYTEDDMYTYLYKGANLTGLDTTKRFTARFNDNTSGDCYFFEDIASKMTEETDGTLHLEYDKNQPQKLLTDDREGSTGLISNKILPNKNHLGDNWRLVLPEAYLYRTAYERDDDMKYNDFMGAFRGIDGVMNSFTGYINAQDLGSIGSKITSNFRFTDNAYLSAECFYTSQSVDGIPYNFMVKDNNGLTYYFNDTAIVPESQTIQSKHPMYIVAVKDDYGNMIRYQYQSGTNILSKIIDTYGREIRFTQPDMNHRIISYEDENGQTQTISYTTEELPPETLQNGSPLEGKPVTRFTVTNQNGEQTSYDSRQTQSLCYYAFGLASTLQKVQSIGKAAMDVRLGNNIERITYPTGAQTNYQYKCIYPMSAGTNVRSGVYAIEKQWDVVDGEASGEVSYTFSETSGNITIKGITNQNESEYQEITRNYDRFGSLEQEQTARKKGNVAADYIMMSYTYDDHNNITRKIVDQYGSGGTSRLITTYDYSASSHQMWQETQGDRQIYYTYHRVNSKPTGKISSTEVRYKSGSNYVTDYKMVTELTADQKEIEYARTIKDGAIQSQVKYAYDTEGNISQTQKWTGDTNKDGVLDDNDNPTVLNSTYTTTQQKTASVTNLIPNVINIEGQDEGDVSMAYEFNIFGYPTSQTDSYGTETRVTYDNINRPILYTFANGATRTIEYNVPQNYSIVTTEAGVQTKNIYDGLGRISSKQLKDGSAWRETAKYTYDKDGRIEEVFVYRDKDGSGSKEEYTYDALNRVKTKTVYELPSQKQYTETYYYSIDHQKGSTVKKKTTAEDGSPAADQTETYDNLGRKVKTVVGENTTSYTYDYLNRCISQTDPKGNTTTMEYNTAGQVTKTTNAAGDSVTNTYDLTGQLISQTDPKGSTAFYTYDKLGNKIQDLTPFEERSNGKVQYYYDKNARLVQQKLYTGGDIRHNLTKYHYDAMGNTIATIGNDGKTDVVVQYEYDKANRMTRMVTGLSSIQPSLSGGTRYEYNALGYVSKVTDPMGQSEIYSEYDYAGNAENYTDKNGNEIHCEYGLYGLERQTVVGKSEEKKLDYTNLGQIKKSSVTNTDGTVTAQQYTYDPYGRLTTHMAGGAVQSYTYDENSNLAGYMLSENGEQKNGINYEYNSLNQLTELSSGGIMTLYEYDKNGNVTNKKVGSDLVTTYEYNDANLITGLTNKKGLQIYNEYSCSYNRDGSKYDERETGKPTKFYSYDKMGRLSSEGEVDEHFISCYNNNYTYDLSGNRIRAMLTDDRADTRHIESYTYDANNRLTGKSTVLADTVNSMSGQVTDYTSYFYDKNGNTTAEQTFTYTTGTESTASVIAGRSSGNSLKVYEYNAFNQLTAYSDGSSSAKYQYNADGLRTKKTVNGQSTGFIWNGTNLAAETNKGSINNTYTYDITGIHSTNQNGTLGIYQKNPHGDVVSVLDSSGAKLNTYNYNAFGNETINEETIFNPFRYTGEYQDLSSGLVYLRNRYYDPSIGRFISEDPIRSGSNWYVYVANNPIRYIDPSGLIITCTEAESKDIIPLLSELAGKSLEFEYKDGEIKITKTYDTKNHVGQTLVASLINSSETVNVNVGVTDTNGNINTKWPASSDPNGVIQIYIDPNDTLGNGTLYTYVDDSTGNVIEEAFPQFILFGHELIHAWREINGLFDGNVEQGQIPYDVGLTWPAEEIKTMGINYTDTAGNSMRNYSTYNGIISENGLRLENGLNVRVSYQGWWK